MSSSPSETMVIQACLDRLQAGDESARQELIRCACGRLERLTRKMLRGWPRVHRWEQTADVLQNSLVRLHRSLSEAKPSCPLEFFRLAALQIRRELHDLAKHYYGPRGLGANHATAVWKSPSGQRSGDRVHCDPCGADEDPANLAAWAEFHAQVEGLPDTQREVFDLLWYQEMPQVEAARLLGISERTLKRRWASARLQLHRVLGTTLPGCGEPVEEPAASPPAPSQQ